MVAVASVVVLLAVAAAWRSTRAMDLDAAKRLFHLRREWLEAEFLTLVTAAGEPCELIWSDCEFADAVVFATDRATGQLRAFSAVTSRLRVDESGETKAGPSERQHSEATAVFQFDGRVWTTEGRAVFNLNPLETVERFRHHLQAVD
jgi:hypothetical protein